MANTRDRATQQRTLAHYQAEAALASAIRAQWLELELVIAERDILLEQAERLTTERDHAIVERDDLETELRRLGGEVR